MTLFKTFLEETERLQRKIADALETRETEAPFEPHPWTREAGGGGTSLQMRGDVLEKAAIGHSHVHGDENPLTGRPFQAGGVSLILHPRNPHAPSVHMNLRRFEETEQAWFGGVVDLNPMGVEYDEDTEHFHRVLREVCQAHDRPYEAWAEACLDYYEIPHRDTNRGVGGVFFDRLDTGDPDADLAFVLDLGEAFLDAYAPILDARKDTPYDEDERRRQLEHRGWYTEFNLVYDEGTRFGFETDADPTAFLASLPPLAAW